MGRVYLAEDPNVGRRIALKVLWPDRRFDRAQGAQLRRRFSREVRAAGRLHHPGIVTVYDAGTDSASGSPFLAMEWVAGCTLRRLLETAGPLAPAEAAALAAQVARALGHAHRREVVHRDVKPTNLLVTDDRRVKLADFGIARLARSKATTAPRVVLGTPCYMAPEQLWGAPADGRCDLFALGAVLYECVTGRRAFGAGSQSAVRRQVLAEAPPAPETIRPGLPPSLGRVIGRALEKRPDDRFQTAADLAAALDRVVAELGAADPGPPPPVSLVAIGAPTAGGGAEEETVRLTARTVAVGAGPAAAGVRARRRRAATAALAATVLLAIWIRGFEPTPDPPPRARTAPAVVADRALTLPESPPHPPPPAAAPTDEPGPEVRPTPPTASTGLPETVLADRTLVCALPAPAPAPHEGAAPTQAAAATLEIVHRNRLRRALLSVWIDGERVLAERLEGTLLARLVGRRLRHRIEVPQGEHAVEVRISGLSRPLEARRSIEGFFAEGEAKHLRVRVRRDRGELDLRWRDVGQSTEETAAWEGLIALGRGMRGSAAALPGL